MDKNKTIYYIDVWTWNGEEYEPLIAFESESLEDVKEKYDAYDLDIDHPKIDLMEKNEQETLLIDYREN